MDKLQITSLNSLFHHFDQQQNTVFWIVNRDVTRQLYVSSAFKNIWGHSGEVLYKNLALWMDFIPAEDRAHLQECMHKRFNAIEENQYNELVFRIIDNQGNYQYIKDTAYLLTDDDGECKGFAGFGEHLPNPEVVLRQSRDAAWQEMQQKFKAQVQGVLQRELGVNIHSHWAPHRPAKENARHIVLLHQGKTLPITQREQQCLYYLMQGYSAKQTANCLHISVRTVEFHLNNLRLKADCRNKTALIAKVMLKKN